VFKNTKQRGGFVQINYYSHNRQLDRHIGRINITQNIQAKKKNSPDNIVIINNKSIMMHIIKSTLLFVK